MSGKSYTLYDPGRERRSRLKLDGAVMKICGCVVMLFYYLSMSVIQNGLMHVLDYGPEELATGKMKYIFYVLYPACLLILGLIAKTV